MLYNIGGKGFRKVSSRKKVPQVGFDTNIFNVV